VAQASGRAQGQVLAWAGPLSGPQASARAQALLRVQALLQVQALA
jgi:hypothetical protein